MPIDKRIMLDALKMEILVIERGGYNPSVHSPHEDPRIFRDSISCLNIGVSDDKKEHPCSSCFLIDFVPEKYKGSNDDPCHKIPLNRKGDTIESLLDENVITTRGRVSSIVMPNCAAICWKAATAKSRCCTTWARICRDGWISAWK